MKIKTLENTDIFLDDMFNLFRKKSGRCPSCKGECNNIYILPDNTLSDYTPCMYCKGEGKVSLAYRRSKLFYTISDIKRNRNEKDYDYRRRIVDAQFRIDVGASTEILFSVKCIDGIDIDKYLFHIQDLVVNCYELEPALTEMVRLSHLVLDNWDKKWLK